MGWWWQMTYWEHKLLIQPPDTENRMSGGVGGVTNAISLPRPDRQIIQLTLCIQIEGGVLDGYCSESFRECFEQTACAFVTL